MQLRQVAESAVTAAAGGGRGCCSSRRRRRQLPQLLQSTEAAAAAAAGGGGSWLRGSEHADGLRVTRIATAGSARRPDRRVGISHFRVKGFRTGRLPAAGRPATGCRGELRRRRAAAGLLDSDSESGKLARGHLATPRIRTRLAPCFRVSGCGAGRRPPAIRSCRSRSAASTAPSHGRCPAGLGYRGSGLPHRPGPGIPALCAADPVPSTRKGMKRRNDPGACA